MKATAVVVVVIAVVVAVLSLAGTVENTINAGIADARASVAKAQAARAWAETGAAIQESGARAALAPARESWGLLLTVAAVVIVLGGLAGVLAAVVRAAHLRASFIHADADRMDGAYPAIATAAGIITLEAPALASRARPAIAAPMPTALALPAPSAPAWAEVLQTFAPTQDRLLLGYGTGGAIYGGLPDLLSVAIVGRPGSGKTNLLRVIAEQATMAGVAVYAWDMHDSMGVAHAETYTEPREIAASAGRIIAELEARRRNGRGRTPVLLMADELPLLSAAVPEAAPALKRIVLEGRKYGIFALLAMQGAAASLFDSGTLTRDALSTRFVFACSPAEARRSGLDTETARLAPGLPVGRAILDGRAVRAPTVVALPLAPAQTAVARCVEPTRFEAAPVAPPEPQAAPIAVESDQERILRLHANGLSLSAIAREVYGTAGGAAFYQVKKVVTDTTTG